MERLQKYKARVFKAALIILVLLLLFTVLSGTVHSLMLPQVSSVGVTMSNTETEHRFTGLVQEAEEGEGFWVVLNISEEDAETLAFTKTPDCMVQRVGTTKEVKIPLDLLRYEQREDGRFTIIYMVDPEETLTPGTPAVLTVTKQNYNVFSVPSSAVFQNAAGEYVVYGLYERQGAWGLEYYVYEYVVLPTRSDYLTTIIEFPDGGYGPWRVAASPTRPLANDMEVDVERTS